ncbi:MAG: RNA-binding protein [Bacteroidales bacterium]|nr:RNA-binding protein [Bacteroidales bacterium]
MKTVKIVIILIALFVIIPGLGYFLWIVQKDSKLDLMIINKSVEKISKNEFRTLSWVLNYDKIVKGNSNSYDYEKDYFGYHPEPIYKDLYIQSFKLSDLSTFKEKYDGLIFLDNKGVENSKSTFSNSRFYGGFNQSDFLLLKEMSAANKLIIAEYNFFSDPTEDLVRFNTEQFIDVYSVLWEGKFMDNLNREKIGEELDPKWLDIYLEYTGYEWDFNGSGLVLINSKQSRILVIPSDMYMTKNYPSINTKSELAAFYGVKETVPYTGWFQIVYEGKNEVISSFDLNLNDAGKQMLMNSGLECTFPATIALSNPHQYFFAGDFSKQKVFLSYSRNRVVSELTHLLCRMRGNKPGQFFHNYYLPMFSTILKDYNSSLLNDSNSN